MTNDVALIEIKQFKPLLVGGLRMGGAYSDCGKAFRKLGRRLGRHMEGKVMMLCYDDEFRQRDADFEPCMPLKRRPPNDAHEAHGIEVRELPGGTCLSMLHHGPYEDLSPSYERLREHARQQGLEVLLPSREIYHKGPGILFKGNPKKYVTELQFPIRSSS